MRIYDVAGKCYLAHVARHVIGCHLTQQTRVNMRVDEVASIC